MVGLLSSRKEPDKDLGVTNIFKPSPLCVPGLCLANVWEEYQGLPVGLGIGLQVGKERRGQNVVHSLSPFVLPKSMTTSSARIPECQPGRARALYTLN